MSLEFYAGIDNFKVDAKGNITITEKLAGSGLLNQLDELQKLKLDGVVRFTIESAVTRYTQKVDAETLEPVEYYERDTSGTWTTVQNEQLSLDVGEDQVIEHEAEITADIIDSFLLTEKYELKSDFNPRKASFCESNTYPSNSTLRPKCVPALFFIVIFLNFIPCFSHASVFDTSFI